MTRTGIGFDAHRLGEGRALVLGGVKLDHPTGLLGHSDGDALLHALTDALLGSVGAPDIGTLFPPGDPEWKDANSATFVERALAIVKERGYRLTSVDAVIIAERPKLSPYMATIRARLAALLGIAAESVGLKATTTDGMGFAGRGEGIAVQAVATVEETKGPLGRGSRGRRAGAGRQRPEAS